MIDRSVIILLGVNILMAWSFYIILLSGQLSFGNAGFMALGAYSSGVATVKLHLPYTAGLLLAVVIGAGVGWLVGLPALRVRGVYLAMMTIGFGFLVQDLIDNVGYVGAQVGFYGMSGTTLAVVAVAVVVLAVLLWRFQASRLARSLQAVREQEVVASTLGLHPTYLKLLSFSSGAAIAALAGALYAHYTTFVSPELFGFFASIWPAFYVAIGGAETIFGPVLGAAIITLLPEYLQPLKEWRLMAFGLIVVLMMAVRPQGLLTSAMFRSLGSAARRFVGMRKAPPAGLPAKTAGD